MRFSSLSQWLQWQEKLHFTEIDPGLERVGEVWRNMGRQTSLPFKVITVAGTNGKGSSVAITAAILQAAGYRTGTYTSPHLLSYNERICINGVPCSDERICEAFSRIDDARKDISLTYFEFATLAAAEIFSGENIDIAVFEVGMGGRLDAVNLFDADIALITPIGLDHTAWLGETREQIGREKAGIIRTGKPLVCAEESPPQSVIELAKEMNVPTFIAGKDFGYESDGNGWHWHNARHRFEHLPFPSLAGHYQLQNSAAVLQVCDLLSQQELTISPAAIKEGLEQVRLPGRFQIIPGTVTRILDVTHNAQGAENLRVLLSETPCSGNTYAVLAMLRDKDCRAVAEALSSVIDGWYVAGLDGSRGLSADKLAASLATSVGAERIVENVEVKDAYMAAMAAAKPGDRILIFGSFHTVEAVMRMLPECQPPISVAS